MKLTEYGMIPSEPPWIVEIDGIKFAAPEIVLLLLKAVSEERDELKEGNAKLKQEIADMRDWLCMTNGARECPQEADDETE